jgi:hypothetical protein
MNIVGRWLNRKAAMDQQAIEERYINKEPLIKLLKDTFPGRTEAEFKVEVGLTSLDMSDDI